MLVAGRDLNSGYELEPLDASPPCGLGFLTTWQLGSQSKYLEIGRGKEGVGKGEMWSE